MQEKKNYKAKEIIKRMFSYIRKYKLSAIAYLILSACVTLINLACAELINGSIGSAIDGRQNDLVKYLLLAGLVLFAGIFITFFSTYIYGRFKSKVILDIRDKPWNICRSCGFPLLKTITPATLFQGSHVI